MPLRRAVIECDMCRTTAKVTLAITSGPLEGRAFEFAEHDTLLFGRRSTCHARIERDPRVSRHHFILEVNPPDARVRDTGSLHGTFVNGVKYGGRERHETPAQAALRQYPEVDLNHGDTITVGRTRMLVQIDAPTACSQCGAEVAVADPRENRKAEDCCLCQACYAELGKESEPPIHHYRPQCCECGKDVSAELKNGRRGEYLCEECRNRMMRNTDVFLNVLRSAAAKSAKSGEVDLEDYDLGRELGRGGMGVVYQATRRIDQAPVAVKVMLAKVAVSERARQMFLREVEIGSRLDHPNLVKITESGSVGSAFYCVMELCAKDSLLDFAKRHKGQLPFESIAPVMVDCLSGLSYAHQQGVVHRDLKPQNVLAKNMDARTTWKISDFGLSKLFQQAGLSGMTATGSAAGTYRFMPREQLTEFKYVRPVSDVWSIAATFYFVLAGRSPREFPEDVDPIEVILKSAAEPIRKYRPDTPRAVAAVIDRALSLNPARRYEDAGEMLTSLRRAL